MIIPIGHEENKINRQPLATYAIMGLCLVIFIFTNPINSSQEEHGYQLLNEAVTYYWAHPYLEVDKRLNFNPQEVQEFEILNEIASRAGTAAPQDEEVVGSEQQKLDALINNAFEILDNTLYRKWGYTPSRPSLFNLLAYMFLHSGWIHLLGNMFFLYLSGPFVEDAFGRPLFVSFYLLAGMGSALFYASHYPNSASPLIGASGAIAGVLGAYMIRYAKRKIRFFYIFWLGFIPKRGTFSSPAWIMLPLWLLREVFSAKMTDAMSSGDGGGVAYWAHVWGFVIGAVVSLGIKFLKVEETLIAPSLDAKSIVVDNTAVEKAMAAREQGRMETAWSILWGELRRHPQNCDAAIALWHLSTQAERINEAAPFLIRAIKDQVRARHGSAAFSCWQELFAHLPDAQIPIEVETKLAALLMKEEMNEAARDVADKAAEKASSDTDIGILTKLAKIVSTSALGQLAATILAHTDMQPGIQAEVEKLLKEKLGASAKLPKIGAGTVPVKGDKQAGSGKTAVSRSISAMKGKFIALDGQKLIIETERQGRVFLNYSTVAAVAAARIGSLENSFLVVDFFLDNPAAVNKSRALRISEKISSPSGEKNLQVGNVMSAVEKIVRQGGVKFIRQAKAAGGKSLPIYSSVKEYESAVLGAN